MNDLCFHVPLFLLGLHVDSLGVQMHSDACVTGQGEGLFLQLG